MKGVLDSNEINSGYIPIELLLQCVMVTMNIVYLPIYRLCNKDITLMALCTLWYQQCPQEHVFPLNICEAKILLVTKTMKTINLLFTIALLL